MMPGYGLNVEPLVDDNAAALILGSVSHTTLASTNGAHAPTYSPPATHSHTHASPLLRKVLLAPRGWKHTQLKSRRTRAHTHTVDTRAHTRREHPLPGPVSTTTCKLDPQLYSMQYYTRDTVLVPTQLMATSPLPCLPPNPPGLSCGL